MLIIIRALLRQPPRPEDEHTRSKLAEIRREVPKGLLAVILIELLLVWLGPYLWEAKSFDILMRLQPQLIGHSAPGPKLAFVDIDDVTFTQWADAEHTTRRSQIWKLIKRIVDDQPTVVVVDMDLSESHADDELLLSHLADYDDHSRVPLIITRRLEQRPSEGRPLPEWARVLDPVPSIIDRLPLPMKQIYFASSGYLQASDANVRTWLLAEPICEGGVQRAIPSVELLVDLLTENSENRSSNEIDTARNFFYGDCGEVHADRIEIAPGRGNLISAQHLIGRITYTIPFPPPGGDGDDQFRYYRAARLVDDVQNRRPPGFLDEHGLFKERIVVIGGSNRASRDNYETPLGSMPGAMVMLNAIKSLLEYGQARELNEIPHFLLGVALGMLVWFGLEIIRIELGILTAMIGGFLAGLISLLLITHGIWLDAYGPIAGAFAHLAVKAAENTMKDWPEHGWKALLSTRLRGHPPER